MAALVKGRAAAATARTSGLASTATVEITGHSLGGALATLYTLENAHTNSSHPPYSAPSRRRLSVTPPSQQHSMH